MDVLTNYPNELTIYLTDQCNLECGYCFVKKGYNKEIELASLEDALFLFLKLPGDEKTISFMGGEPLLTLEKIEKSYSIIQSQKKNFCRLNFNINTNGTLIDKNTVDFLKESRAELKISIDGKKEFHDAIRHSQSYSSYSKIIDNLRILRKYRIPLKANLVFTPNNFPHILENIKHLHNLGFKQIDFYPDLSSFWNENQLLGLNTIFSEFAYYYIGMFTRGKDMVFINSFLYALFHKKRYYNSLFCNKIHLYCDGNIYLCDKVFSLPLNTRSSYIIGDRKNGLNNTLRLSMLKGLRKKIQRVSRGKCESCRFLQYCFCPIGSYLFFTSNGNGFKDYYPVFCSLSRIYITNFLKIVLALKDNTKFRSTYV